MAKKEIKIDLSKYKFPKPMYLEVSKFRAINEAVIELNGITVIAGENGSGKSTLSRLLYNSIKYSSHYELVVFEEVENQLREVNLTLSNLGREVNRYLRLPSLSRGLYNVSLNDISDLEVYEKRLNKRINIIEEYVRDLFDKIHDPKETENSDSDNRKYSVMRFNRIGGILENVLEIKIENIGSIFDLFDNLKSKIRSVINNAKEQLEKRPLNLFNLQLSSIFGQDIKDIFNLTEFGTPIMDWESHKLGTINWIKDSIYIDTPMAYGNKKSDDPYWIDLDKVLRTKKPIIGNKSLSLIDNIISGEVMVETDDEDFEYRRKDGSVFNLDECATGIKSFGLLQLLLRNGQLTKDTLLIIDEPEAHLHPQWIVEYARIIIKLNKVFGVKFFIASHNPDMVSAIKYIAMKEGIDGGVTFYLAQKADKEGFSYNYKNLGINIEKIFASFNIAFDRIHKYGLTE